MMSTRVWRMRSLYDGDVAIVGSIALPALGAVIAIWSTAAGHGSMLPLAVMVGYGRFIPPPFGLLGFGFWLLWACLAISNLRFLRLLAAMLLFGYHAMFLYDLWAARRAGDFRYLGCSGLFVVAVAIVWQVYAWRLLRSRSVHLSPKSLGKPDGVSWRIEEPSDFD